VSANYNETVGEKVARLRGLADQLDNEVGNRTFSDFSVVEALTAIQVCLETVALAIVGNLVGVRVDGRTEGEELPVVEVIAEIMACLANPAITRQVERAISLLQHQDQV